MAVAAADDTGISAVSDAMDGFDRPILGCMCGPIVMALHRVRAQVGARFTSTLVGVVAGGILFVTLAACLGRVRVLTRTSAVFTGACAPALNMLFNIGRCIGGCGLVVAAGSRAKRRFPTAIAQLAVLYLLDLVALAVLGAERRGAAPA